MKTANGKRGKFSHAGILKVPIGDICPSPENDTLYHPIDPQAADFRALVESIKNEGVREPLVITLDNFILSGHRRHCAASWAGLTEVPCRFEEFKRGDDQDRFLKLLREYNRQRVKSFNEVVREEVLSANPEESYESLINHRKKKSKIEVDALEIVGEKRRAQITVAKKPFLDAIKKIVEEQREFWPLSDRRIHYALLNDPPLKHASKPDSTYRNDKHSYNSLVELLTRARLAVGPFGERIIPFEAIADETRPVITWRVWQSVGDFVRDSLADLLNGYWRDLMRSQPNHVEIVGEKSTLAGTLKPVAMEYTIPLTLGRGYCSLPPRREMYKRYARSGKEWLVILLISDHDPDGEEISHSFARSMRDDFNVEKITPIKVALNGEHVGRFNLIPVMEAKETSVHHDKFVERHGKNVWEVEALEPAKLQGLLRDTIDAVIDRKAFNLELDQEKKDAARLDTIRKQVLAVIGDAAGELTKGNGD